MISGVLELAVKAGTNRPRGGLMCFTADGDRIEVHFDDGGRVASAPGGR